MAVCTVYVQSKFIKYIMSPPLQLTHTSTCASVKKCSLYSCCGILLPPAHLRESVLRIAAVGLLPPAHLRENVLCIAAVGLLPPAQQ